MAFNIAPIQNFLKKEYPLPKPDPRWIKQCVAALQAAGTEPSEQNVQSEYLFTDLAHCTLPSSAIPEGDLHNVILFPIPTLLQVHSVAEIGNSAFQVQTVMEQRSEVLSGRTRIRGLGDAEQEANGEEGEEEEVEDGRVPPYPRSMLKLDVGDGRKVLKAIELQRIPDFVLGQTNLGSKILVHYVKVRRGILLLTPQNTQVIDSCVDDLEANQREMFVRDLKRRLGKLEPGEDDGEAAPRIVIPPPVRDGGQRRGAGGGQPRARARPRARAEPRAKAEPKSEHQDAPAPTTSRFFKTPKRSPSPAAGPSKRPAQIPTRTRDRSPTPDFDDEGDSIFDAFDESFYDHVDQAAAQSKSTASGSGTGGRKEKEMVEAAEIDDDDDDDDDFMILDESVIRQLDDMSSRPKVGVPSTTTTTQGIRQKGVAISSSTSKGKPQYIDPDDGDETDYGMDEDLDESFVRQVDEQVAALVGASKTASKTVQVAASTKRSLGTPAASAMKGSQWKKTFSTDISSDEDDLQKENRKPEIIEISD
ncbi:hypothetical protein I350_01621 [Cryptococcus amylolentus CBS 6273]|uniref:RecQ-mediated genome instability protein 1 n=1 Tax=Cryptococcus amylolentus CBS 6273 TaxID=1296118 RepID=A0A1E3KD42_9TREE|nr:hypothetical protein I350_01621 [Cryptococcus amylolentus CBS 6273]